MRHSFDTRAVHAATFRDNNASAVSTPITLSTTFERESDGSIGEYLYSRYSNPNRELFEQAMCSLEQGTNAFAFSSGLAATMSILQTLQSGDHVVIPDDAYYGLRSQLTELFVKFGVSHSIVDCTNLDAVEKAMTPNTRIVWTESPSNPMLKITDLDAVSAIAHQHSAIVVCDNTWATPLLQRPFDHGCDVVMHSATKYIGGHSDVLMGVVVLRSDDDLTQKLQRIQMIGGAVPSPFECWLASRGLQTLPTRVRAACQSAEIIALHFENHARIERVLYPGLSAHPGYAISRRLMTMPGAMLSMMIRGTTEQALAVASSTNIFRHATSLGSVESLIEHRQSVEPPNSLTPGNLVRLSIGLESADDLIEDIEQALRAVFIL